MVYFSHMDELSVPEDAFRISVIMPLSSTTNKSSVKSGLALNKSAWKRINEFGQTGAFEVKKPASASHFFNDASQIANKEPLCPPLPESVNEVKSPGEEIWNHPPPPKVVPGTDPLPDNISLPTIVLKHDEFASVIVTGPPLVVKMKFSSNVCPVLLRTIMRSLIGWSNEKSTEKLVEAYCF